VTAQLVIGASGTVGGATLNALQAAGAEPIAFVRDRDRALRILGETVPLRVGGLEDPRSLHDALSGVDALLLCSGNDPEMREYQLAAVRAIEDSDVRRTVKISGSPVSIGPDSPARTGRHHLEIEDALRATDRQTIAIRPNAFMQNFLDQALAVAHGALPGPEGQPRVSFIDAEDVGRVAAVALLSKEPPEPILEVTGPEALTWFEVADTMSEVLDRRVTHYPVPPQMVQDALLAMGRPRWHVEHVLELAALMCQPKAAEVTDTVQRLTGQQPRALRGFLEQHAATFPAAA
jgi:uncharacterized protein YbjT (DUF2867 family)